MKRRWICILLALAAVCAGTASCGKRAQVSETAGVGRVPRGTSDALDTADPTETGGDTDGETEPPETAEPVLPPGVGGEPSAAFVDGKYVYTIPVPDRSGLLDLSAVNALSREMFSDANGATDWYPGKTERDLTTGEVRYVWDRAADTKALLEKYGAIYRKNEDEKVVYFTFDCGYENGYTGKILDVLQEKNVPGLFFVVGHYVNTAKDIIQRMYDEGHLVGNHTNHHPNMATDVDAQAFIEEITSLEDMLAEAFPGAPMPVYWRPPYGACNEWTLAMAEKMGLTTVLWSWAHMDYVEDNQPDPAYALEKAKKGLHNGAVYLFHCVGQTNVDILGPLIDYIRAEGYEIRPMCE